MSSGGLSPALMPIHIFQAFLFPFLCCKMVSKEVSTTEGTKNPSATSKVEPDEVHVLAVDDSLIDRSVIERFLKTSAYKVTTVDSGTRALEYLGIAEALGPANLNAFQVNLIITDYCMPGMTGYDLLKKIKKTSALKEIPVVIMSSENVPTRISSSISDFCRILISDSRPDVRALSICTIRKSSCASVSGTPPFFPSEAENCTFRNKESMEDEDGVLSVL